MSQSRFTNVKKFSGEDSKWLRIYLTGRYSSCPEMEVFVTDVFGQEFASGVNLSGPTNYVAFDLLGKCHSSGKMGQLLENLLDDIAEGDELPGFIQRLAEASYLVDNGAPGTALTSAPVASKPKIDWRSRYPFDLVAFSINELKELLAEIVALYPTALLFEGFFVQNFDNDNLDCRRCIRAESTVSDSVVSVINLHTDHHRLNCLVMALADVNPNSRYLHDTAAAIKLAFDSRRPSLDANPAEFKATNSYRSEDYSSSSSSSSWRSTAPTNGTTNDIKVASFNTEALFSDALRGELIDLMLDFYRRKDDLTQFVRFALGQNIALFANTSGNLEEICKSTVRWTEKNELMVDLLNGILNDRPSRVEIKVYVLKLSRLGLAKIA